MKKIVVILAICCGFTDVIAQKNSPEPWKLIQQNQKSAGLTDSDLLNSLISDYIPGTGSEESIVYLQQAYAGIPVFNQLQVLAFRDGKLISKTGGRLKGFDNKVALQAQTPVISALDAVAIALTEKQVTPIGRLSAKPAPDTRHLNFGNAGVCLEDITAELLWLPYDQGKKVALAWQIFLSPKKTGNYWLVRIDAVNGRFLNETNLTVSCNWNEPHDRWVENLAAPSRKQNALTKHDLKNLFKVDLPVASSPEIVSSASYRVVPYPAESPVHPGGTPVLIANPWNNAPGNATSLKWHNNGTTDFITTRGNNVWATEDRADANNSSGQPATSTTSPDPLTFNFPPNFAVAPTQALPVNNQSFNITNLFYWNNIMHDLTYQYGFNELSGNFQASNQGRGGAGNDYVVADAQDGGGTNNANFSTPPDGSRPRMQMYLWNAAPTVSVNAPAVIAGSYSAVESGFSNANKLTAVGSVTGNVVYFNDNSAGSTHEACGAAANSVTGKIVLIDRGTCNFAIKVKNAQTAGAIAAIVINNVPGDAFVMGGADNTITIPAVMISQSDGAIISAAVSNGLNVTLGAVQKDGDVDNGIVCHEYTHGISNRLTGGPSQAACVANAENMGEGWSDYYSLMMTQNWATSGLNDGFTKPRAMGTYAIGQPVSGSGIRSQKYCTDMTVNTKVYAAFIPAESHDRGEIWCAVLWDMTWAIIEQVGSISPNLFDANAGGGNIIALKLVTEGMKLQPCGPGFIDGRDAIIQADINLYGGAHLCAIREAFRRRGMGPNASQGSPESISDQVPDFSPALKVELTQTVSSVPAGNDVTYTNTVSTCSPISNYLLTDTLPANVTYVNGGTYNAGTRVVSFEVNQGEGVTQSYSFTVNVNPDAFYTPVTVLSENMSGATIPASLTATSSTAANWKISNAQSSSSPNAIFSPDTTVVSTQTLVTTSAINLPANQSSLSFMHKFDTEASYDGGVIEISTNNGTSWIDLDPKVILNRYPITMDPTTGTVIAARKAYSGLSGGFIKTVVNLSSFAGQSIKLRWLFSSDNGTGGNGWYVDDILLKNEAVVNMRSTLFTSAGVRVNYADTVTLITTAACVNAAISSQPEAVTACAGSNASFSVTATGTSAQYQWQVSTDGGSSFNDINGATSSTLNLTGVTASMNNNRYRVIVSNNCPSNVISSVVVLTVSIPASITSQPVNNNTCVGENAIFSVGANGSSNTYQWQVSTDGGNTFTNIPGATGSSLTVPSVTTAQNGNIYHVIISSCSSTPVTSSNATLNITSAVSVSAQPFNTTVCTGNNASFSVTAGGSNLLYQWQVSTNGGISFSDISGQTNATLNLNAVTSSMNGNIYQVLISNSCGGSLRSSAATLTVSTPASISAQPLAAVICAGSNANFSVTATGNNLNYQWQVSTDGGNSYSDITGATNSTLSLNAVSAAMNGNMYRVRIGSCDPDGLNSLSALLTVNSPASITAQPADLTVCTGNNAVFSATATGTDLSYQWQVSTDGGNTFTDIGGEANSTLSLVSVNNSMNGNRYRVMVNSGACPPAINSSASLLTVNNAASIASDPESQVTCSGTDVNFVADASGVSYQWQVSTDDGNTFTDIAGANSTTLSLNAVTASMNNNQYRLAIFSCGPDPLHTTAATLTVNSSASISVQPTAQAKCAGENINLNVTAAGPNLSYQWQVSSDGGISFTDVAGATENSLTLNNLTTSQNGNIYHVVIGAASPCGSLTSSNVILTVNPLPIVGVDVQPGNIVCAGSNVSLSGTGAETYNWDNGVQNNTSFSVSQTTTFTVTGTSAAGCSSTASQTITVNPLPTVTISASPYSSLYQGLTTTITAISNPSGTVYGWLKDGSALPAQTGNSITVDASQLGTYQASFTDANGCVGFSNELKIKDSVLSIAFIYPNPNHGLFYITHVGNGSGPETYTAFIYDGKGSRIVSKAFTVTTVNAKLEMNVPQLSHGTYMVLLRNSKGVVVGKGKVTIL